MYSYETRLKVRYVETDQMGVVHHSKYYPWFEVARTEFFESIGLPYDKIEEDGILFPLIESGCIYKEGAKYPDDLLIKAWIDEIKGAKFTFLYEVLREQDQKLLAKGKTVHTAVDKEFRLVNLKRQNPKLWEKLQTLIK